MKYINAVESLNSFVNFERANEVRDRTTPEDIDRFAALLCRLGDPHRQYQIIHVAGTKGKGSTAAFLASILVRAGYHVGLYTSPHLISVRERIRVDGRMISPAEFARCYSQVSAEPAECRIGSKAAFRTVFEHLTALAFLNFATKKVDVAVVEAGLGGRLDTTIVVDPVVSVLTPIGLDHTLILGETVPDIAWEKSFVIKPGVPAVLAVQSPEALRVLVDRAREVEPVFHQSPGSSEFTDVSESLRGTSFMSSRAGLKSFPLHTPLVGDFQLGNISTALTTIDVLRYLGWSINDRAIIEGLRRIRWPGRLQVVNHRPLIVLDGAHNALSAVTAVESLKKLLPRRKWRVVFGVMKNKQYPDMLAALQEIAERFYLCPLQFPKSWTEDMAREVIPSLPVASAWYPEAASAYERALKDTPPDGRILVIGSLYLVGEMLRHRRGLPAPTSDGRIDGRI